jgi:hypothetical protein
MKETPTFETRQAAVERVLDMRELPFERKARLLADLLFGELEEEKPCREERERVDGEDTEAST